MYRILIVEDDPRVLDQLAKLLREALAKFQIDTARTTTEGLRLLKAASDGRRPYDVVILDFLLPEDKGENPEMDESLCLEIREAMPRAFIAHITAYPEDHAVLKHLGKYHTDPLDPRGISLSKLGASWTNELLRKIKGLIYGTCVNDQMDKLFGANDAAAPAARHRAQRGGTKGDDSTTHDLAALCRDIVAYWSDLDGRLKRRIHSVFRVDPDSKPIRISLL